MENQSNIFNPKYSFIKYINAITYVGIFGFTLFLTSRQPNVEWQDALLIVLSGFSVYQISREFIRKIEFKDSEMVVQYFVWPARSIDYCRIKKIDVGYSITGEGFSIQLRAMKNRLDLQYKLADFMKKFNIKEFDLERQIKAKRRKGIKILKISLISTIAIGLLASLFVGADIGVWALMLLLLFVSITLILNIFIKE